MKVSRRTLLATGASTLATPLLGQQTATAATDVIVIGAGASGISAARELRKRGYQIQLIEAANRIGGRVFSQSETFGVPYDVGAHWLHYAEQNPFVGYGQENGFDLYPAPSHEVHYIGDRLSTEQEDAALSNAIESANDAMLEAGSFAKDVAASTAIPDLGNLGLTTSLLVGAYEMAKDPNDFSCVDWYTAEDGTDWYCREGFGTLFAHSATDVPVHLNVTGHTIRWGSRGVEVETDKGTLTAQAVLVTVSTGVLANETIKFEPALPVRKQEAINALKMGHYHHVALQIEDNFFGIGEDGYFRYQVSKGSLETPQGFAALVDACGHGITYCDIGGSFAKDMSDAGIPAMYDFVISELKQIFGADIENAISRHDTFDWTKDPLTQGAYASAEPGGAWSRQELRRPENDRIWFAGEATSVNDWATVAGAHKAGIKAADAITRSIQPI